jgi:hypothetical protein
LRIPKTLDFWTGDSETDPFHHCDDPGCLKCHGLGRVPEPFIWGAYHGGLEEYLEFDSSEEFASYFAPKRSLCYAHNGGKFDYHYLRDYINSDQPLTLINGRLSRFKIGECEFRDSLNIFPNTALADFGVKNEIDYDLMEPERRTDPNVRAEISRYLRQDCVGLWQEVARYRSEFGKSLTQATASMKYWEKKYFDMPAPRQTKSQFDRCRPFYYGGRVQCFEQGVKTAKFSVADINSAYPRAMLETHPISPIPTITKRLPGREADLATSLIRIEATARGCFPWREKQPDHGEGCDCDRCRKGELFFPDDSTRLNGRSGRTRIYTITGWELIAALELDAVANIRVIECLQFPQKVNFKDYIDHFYQMRLEADAKGDKAGKIFGKYFMNSLYGKFGADCTNYAEYVIATSDSFESWKEKGYERYQDWAPAGGTERILMERKPNEADLEDVGSRWRYYNVATAASITGYVRSFLFRSMHRCSGLIYCDTDSIAARETTQLEYGKELGKWKDEGHFDEFRIAGKKLYAFHKDGAPIDYDPEAKEPNWKIASKGVNFAAMNDAPDMIGSLAQGGEITHRPQVPTYSITREAPRFINRSLRSSTVKNMSQAPDPQKFLKEMLAPTIIRV